MRFISLSLLVLCAALAFGADCNTSGYACLNMDSQIKGSRPPSFGVDTGAANAYVVTTVAPLGPSLKPGSKLEFIATHTNTGASTVVVDGGSAISIVKQASTPLVANDIKANCWLELGYDGTNFHLLNLLAAGGSVSFDPNTVTLFDDFVGGATTQALGWTANGGGGSITNQPNPSGPLVPGLIEVTATTTNTTWEYLELGISNTGGEHFNPQAQTFKVYFRADNQNGSTSGTIRLGMFDNRGVQNPTNGVYFESGTAQSNGDWWCVQENASTITKADSGITAPTATYHTLEIDASSTTTVGWKIDGSTVCGGIAGTNVPNANLTIAAEASSTGTAPKVWLDYFRLDLTTTGR